MSEKERDLDKKNRAKLSRSAYYATFLFQKKKISFALKRKALIDFIL